MKPHPSGKVGMEYVAAMQKAMGAQQGREADKKRNGDASKKKASKK